jgi:cell division protein FtsI (penicillin-binding protein 3)
MDDKSKLGRFRIFIIGTAILIGIIIVHYGSLMLFRHSPPSKPLPSKPLVERGPILDRNGRILAIQTRLYSVTAWIPSVTDPAESASLLSSVLDIPDEEILSRLRNQSGFLYIKRKISPTESEEIRQLKENGKLEGFSLEPEYGRNYPEKQLASQVIGYVGMDNIGLNGIEYTYENELSPDTEISEQKEVYGNQIFLTIDLNIQYFTEQIAERAYNEHNADTVMMMVMDAKNGDILSSVSLPNYDPNSFNKYSQDDRKNRPISYAYEPGSVFKIFSLSSFLQIGGLSADQTFFCEGFYPIEPPGDREVERLKCLGVHGNVTPQKIIQYSCNAGAAYASETVEKSSFHFMLKEFGFGSPTGLPLPGESYGLLRDPEDWSYRSKPTIAIGQEISVTAVQMVTAATALANGGTLLKPHIIKKVVDPEGKVLQENKKTAVRKVINSEFAELMLDWMETATEVEGTADRSRVPGIRISAKTGTAQILDRETGKYATDAFVPSCLAIFPTDDPRFILYVVIVNPKAGEYYGGRIAAPLIGELADELVTYYGMPKAGDRIVRHPGQIRIERSEPLSIGEELPDLTGLSKREILPLFQDERINIIIHGQGWVTSQKPAPGTVITDGMTIILDME